jgi:hypothetical protein
LTFDETVNLIRQLDPSHINVCNVLGMVGKSIPCRVLAIGEDWELELRKHIQKITADRTDKTIGSM